MALVVALLLVAAPRAAGAAEPPWSLEGLLSQTEIRTAVSSGRQLLRALNASAGSPTGEVLFLQDDIRILPADVAAFKPWLPINGGNRTVVLLGGRTAAPNNHTVLDFGGAVNLMYHPVGHALYTFGLALQGMAPASAGIAGGMTTQMVGGVFWPSTTGEAQHIMGFWNSTINTVSPSCGLNATNFTVNALHQVLGRSDTVRLIDDSTFFVGQPLNGSYAVRITQTGDPAGAVRWSLYNTTMHCRHPDVSADAALPSPTTPAEAAALLASHSAATGIAGTADELLYLLSSPQVTRILLGGHISLQSAQWQAYSLPLVLQDRSVIVESHDQQLKVLDLGSHPRLLYLSAASSLTFSHVYLQGSAQPSTASGRSTIIVGSPVWPTVDGEQGHQLLFLNSTLRPYVTPCSPNSTQLTMGRLRQVLGKEAIVDVGPTGYLIVPRFQEIEPVRSILTQGQVGSTPYTYENTVVQCQEDPGVALAAAQAPLPSSGTPPWAIAVVAVAAVAGAAVIAAAGVLVWRRWRRRSVGAVKVRSSCGLETRSSTLQPDSPSCATVHRMESGELAEGDEKLRPDSKPGSKLICQSATGLDSFGTFTSAGTTGRPSTAAQQLSEAGRRGRDALWRARYGLIDGLEIGELLGRGAFGKVYKGRWNGAIVAVKVVEHSVSGNDPSSLSREPLLCMSVSHPNCITTYKLSVIRLLKSDDPLGSEDSALSLPDIRLSDDSNDSSMLGEEQTGKGPRLLRSLLSGAEAVEVEDPHGPLQPGLYETWIVSEYCERGTLGDILAQKALKMPDGSPHMANIYLCLMDVATGMQYLHSLGVMHSDLKPANVLLKGARTSQRGFTCKLADFGLSRMLDGRATHVETGSYGTPTHAAPELLREGRLSPAVDVFAFGILAWELVAGEDAYRGWHPMQIIMQVSQHGTRPPPLPHCPPGMAALMERCWAQEPADRPTFTEILAELQPLLQGERQGASPTPPRLPPPPADRQAAAEVGAGCHASVETSAEAGSRSSPMLPPVGEVVDHRADQHLAHLWQRSADHSQAAAGSEAAG